MIVCSLGVCGHKAVFLPSEDQAPGYSFLTPRAHLGENPPHRILFLSRFITALGRGEGIPKVHCQKPALSLPGCVFRLEGHSQ